MDSLHVPEQHLAEHDSDPLGAQRGYVRGTDYSLPYISQWSRLHPEESATLLRHLNCSYLSTHGSPPTLLSLKQHAQALCNLILALVPTRVSGEIDAFNAPRPDGGSSNSGPDPLALQYRKNDAFDFLTDLRTPYTNDDPDHQLPLNSLVNEVKSRSDLGGTNFHCALELSPQPRKEGHPVRPYENHHNLIMHANDCLERLDHEFSPEGGLMAILPGDEIHEAADRKAARNSLLGQWLGFTQHLVRRTHELEIAYGNALDIVQADAVLPMQALSAAGPDGRSTGRPVAFPQDRWVLANAGDDVFGYVHKLLDAREAVDQERENVWRKQGVSGRRTWKESKEGQIAARGIVAVNIGTRYYRLAGQGHGTVFVVPAWELHPATDYTKVLEKKPGVVGVPVAKWPERMSEIEKRFEGVRQRDREEMVKNVKEREQVLRAVAEQETMRSEMERLEAEVSVLEQYVGAGARDFAREAARMKAELDDAYATIEAERENADEKIAQMQKQIEQLEEHAGKRRRRSSRSEAPGAGA